MVQQHEGLQKAEATIVTVFDFQDASCISAELLEDRLESYLGADDVFQREFLQGVMIIRGMTTQVDKSVAGLFVSWGTKWSQEVLGHTLNHNLSVGPYVLDVNGLSQIWKLYDDFNNAFLVSTWPSQTVEGDVSCPNVMCTLLTSIRSYENLRVGASGYTHLAIAVPSRLYFRKTNARPLAGARIAVKDIFHLKGVKTSCCSRGYHDLYPAQDTTALSIQTLVDLGAQIVGKTHLSSFALREEPTECVDYQAPFNPRADGYQSPAGSSSGSGAAIASYGWLDFTLGTDSKSSPRRRHHV
jgi:Amidase